MPRIEVINHFWECEGYACLSNLYKAANEFANTVVDLATKEASNLFHGEKYKLPMTSNGKGEKDSVKAGELGVVTASKSAFSIYLWVSPQKARLG